MSLSRDLGVALQLLLPHQLLSRIVYYATRWTWRPWKRLLIRSLTRAYRIDLGEALDPDPESYASFNAFFTRALKPQARPIEAADGALVCPADGAISQIGPISDGRIVQAKGMDYAVAELLGGRDADAALFAGGGFATIYLSPRDYHRVHAPCGGRLVRAIHVPGRLFSVAPWTTESIPRLFVRNERLALLFETAHGPLAVVLVGAIFVSSIETVFDGEVTPPYADQVRVREYSGANAPTFEIGAELGRFNMGSTVILLTGADLPAWDNALTAGARVRMGQRIST
ncbi:MAG: phosphatidylserine decarboxylase [Xanthomonadales bacterium]|nr:Phosphatidylserine decarboxylase proenzyme [Xanthomonadales bacterium]MCC6591911.1 phosphatidylserine decarboxylase [Xanthomonadales bacterium]MCE7930053.1 phosphatidylserine decarboxylase [Xanthomonadales bacterium PRO6]